MADDPKQTPLTVENFKELLMPEINKQFDIVFKEIKSVRSDLTGEIKSVRSDLTGEIKSVRSDLTGEIKSVRSDLTGEIKSVRSDLTGEIKSVRSDLTKLAHIVKDLKETVEETNENIKYLPTTEAYLNSQDKIMNELQKSREATEFTGQHYADTNDRIDRIDKFIGVDSNLN